MSNGEKDAGCSFPLPARPALACRWDGVEMSVGVERWASSFPVKAIALWWSTLKRETLSGISLEVRLEKVVPRPFDEISGVMSCPAHCKWCKLPTFDRRLRWGQQPSMYRVYDHCQSSSRIKIIPTPSRSVFLAHPMSALNSAILNSVIGENNQVVTDAVGTYGGHPHGNRCLLHAQLQGEEHEFPNLRDILGSLINNQSPFFA